MSHHLILQPTDVAAPPHMPPLGTTREPRVREIYAGAVQGAVWTYLSFVGSKLLVFVSTMILARLLAPAQFGQVGFALVVITYLDTIGNLGIGAALIYEPRDTMRAANLTFVVSLLMGGMWALFMVLAAPQIAGFFRDPAAQPVLRAMAWIILLKSLGSTHEALLRRRLAFKRRIIPDGAEAIVKGVSSIALALLGGGIWSLVWGQLLGAAAFTLALWIVIPWRPRWEVLIVLARRLHQAVALARRMLGYGAQIVVVNVLAAVLHHVDLVIVGRLLGGAALGFYTLACRIPELVILMLIRVMGNVTFPAYSRLQEDRPALQRAFLSTLRYLSLVTVPAGLGMAILAEPMVLTLYGNAWHPSIPVLQALAIAATLRSLGSHAGEIYKAIGRPDVLTNVGLIRAAVLIPTLAASTHLGIAGVALAQLAVTGASTVLNLFVAGRLLRIRWSAMLAEVRPALLGAGVMCISLAGLRAGMAHGTHLMSLVIPVGIGAAVYALSVWRMNPAVVKQVCMMVTTSLGLSKAASRV